MKTDGIDLVCFRIIPDGEPCHMTDADFFLHDEKLWCSMYSTNEWFCAKPLGHDEEMKSKCWTIVQPVTLEVIK